MSTLVTKAKNQAIPGEERPDDPTTCKDGGDDCTLFQDVETISGLNMASSDAPHGDGYTMFEFIASLIEQELEGGLVGEDQVEEANSLGSGNVVGYTGPLGMDTAPGHKKLWSGDKKEPNKVSRALAKEEKEDYHPMPSELWEVWEEEMSKENVLDAMGMHHVGSAKYRKPYGDTYVDKSDTGKQAKIVKKVNKNLGKKPYSLHDPPSMGLSITRPGLKDRK